MKIRKTGLTSRSAGVLAGALATVVVSLAASFVSPALAYDLKGYSPAQCRSFSSYSTAGVYYNHDRVQNTSTTDYAMVVCPAIVDTESYSPYIGINVYFNKPIASPGFYCYVFAVNLASSSYRWYYNYDGTTAGIGGLYMSSIPSFRYGSSSVICGMPPRSELLNYYAGES